MDEVDRPSVGQRDGSVTTAMRKSLTDFRRRCSWAATFLAGQRVQVGQWTLADCVAAATAFLPEGRPLSLLAQEGIDQPRQRVDNVVRADHFRVFFLEDDRPVETEPRDFRGSVVTIGRRIPWVSSQAPWEPRSDNLRRVATTPDEVWQGSFHCPPR